VRLAHPSVTKKINRRLRLRSTAALALGLYFLIHGVPVLTVFLSPSSGEAEQSRPGTRLSARGRAKLRQFVALHFVSLKEFRRFMVITGGSLTVLGAGLYIWGLAAIKKENAPAAAEGDTAAPDSSANFEGAGSAVRG